MAGKVAEFGAGSVGIYGVAAVVAWAIGDEGDEGVCGFAAGWWCVWIGGVPGWVECEFFIYELAEEFDEVYVFPFVAAAEVVRVADFSFLDDEVNAEAVVFDVEPVADIEAIAVDGEWEAAKGVGYAEGDEFFWEVERAVIV